MGGNVPDSTTELIKLFHQDTGAKLQLGGAFLEEIDAVNGLRQGCCMAPLLFKFVCMYTC